MNNKAQVSFEYLVLIALIVILGAVVMTVAGNYFTMSGAVKETGELYRNRLKEMITR